MIRNSFIFLDGVRFQKEKMLWSQGIKNWDDFLDAKSIPGIGALAKYHHNRQIMKAKENLYALNSEYFKKIIPQAEHWRLYEFFREEAIFLDIETTGLDFESNINVIGLFDGINTKIMIRGINLDYKILQKELLNYKLIITFNGAAFDVPFLKKRYPDLMPNVPHFDLKHCCARLGLTGGLKEIEKQLGIERKNEIVKEFHGGDAAVLWRMYRATMDDYYLNLLIEYNEEDTINLRFIADYVYNGLKKRALEGEIEKLVSPLCQKS